MARKTALKVILIFLLTALFLGVSRKNAFALTFEERKQYLIDNFAPPKDSEVSPGNNDPTSINHVFTNLYLNRYLNVSNRYLEQVKLIGERTDKDRGWDFISLFLFRMYYMFKDSGKLTPLAIQHLHDLLKFWLELCDQLPYPQCCNDSECYVYQNENHEIIQLVLYYLARQEFGRDTTSAEAAISQWITRIAGKNLEEYNSPIYTDRTIMGILTLYDFARNPRVKLKAQMILDFLFANYAAASINQIRCGPATRAYQTEYSDGQETTIPYIDRDLDGMYELGYLFFGHGQPPARIHMSTAHNLSTTYRPAEIIYQLATQNQKRGSYSLKTRGAHLGLGIDRNNIYYYVSPSFVIGTIQGLQVPSVPAKTQIWSLCLVDSPQTQIYSNNAFFQHQSTLIYDSRYSYTKLGLNPLPGQNGWDFFKGDHTYIALRDNLFTYNNNTPADTTDDRRIAILEVREISDFASFDEFKNRILSRSVVVSDKSLSYTNTFGTAIYYNVRTNEAKINQQIVPWNDYPLFESPYLNSGYESGLVNLEFDDKSLILDFRDMSDPKRIENNGNCPRRTLGNLDCDTAGLINETDLTIFLKNRDSQTLSLENLLANWGLP